MKDSVYIALALMAAMLLLTGCVLTNTVAGSGDVVETEFHFINFREVEIHDTFHATITEADNYSVVVHSDDNLVGALRLSQDGEVLTVKLEDRHRVSEATLRVEITLPRLDGLRAFGASNAQINDIISGDVMRFEAQGASEIHGDVSAADLELEAQGIGRIFLAGTAGNIEAEAGGGSTIDLTELSAVDAQVEANGGSSVTVNLDGGILDARASGGSSVWYIGDVELGDIRQSGGSTVGPR